MASASPLLLRPLASLLLLALLLAASMGPSGVAADVNVTWTDVATMPYATGETSAGILEGSKGEPLLLVMGWNNNQSEPNAAAASAATMVLDINANEWSVRAQRPFVGHHMAAVTANNKLYLIGGYRDGTTANMQIYDPISDTWSVGPKPLVRSAAASATLIGDTIFHCGGVDRGDDRAGLPINRCNKFNITAGRWSGMASMPHAVHHASMATDGKLVYVFGGRNSRAGTGLNPVNYTQIYNPENNSWTANTRPGGPSATPVGRGGMGAAVFYKGYFYIIGGEVRCGGSWMGSCPNPSINYNSLGVHDRVDRYDPATNTWDRGLPGMSLPRHGAYPVVGPAPKTSAPVVYVCAGGIQQSFSENTLCTYMSVP